MINGALVMLYLASRGASTSQIGLFNTLISLVNLGTTVFLSSITDRKSNPLRFEQRILFFGMLLALLMPLSGLLPSSMAILLVVSIATVQTVLQGIKALLSYKVPYQLITPERYGHHITLNGACSGVAGIGVSALFSVLIAAGTDGSGYLMVMGFSAILMAVSFFTSKRLTVINHDFDNVAANSMDIDAVIKLLKAPIFRWFLIPNLLRGITLGVTNSMPLFALAMGLNEMEASVIPTMVALSGVATSLIYRALEKRVKLPNIGLLACVLLCALMFLPHDNSILFLILFFVGYTGRRVIDDVMPIMTFHMIDPETAGTYNAWRCVLIFLVSTVTVYLVGVLLERIDPIWLLIPGVLGYVISMIWYKILYRHFVRTEEPAA